MKGSWASLAAGLVVPSLPYLDNNYVCIWFLSEHMYPLINNEACPFSHSTSLIKTDDIFSTLDTTPPPAAPFNHRIVSAKPNQICNFYNINWQEVLGGWALHSSNLCVE